METGEHGGVEAAARVAGAGHPTQQQDLILFPPPGGVKIGGQQKGNLANAVIKAFRETTLDSLDITGGLGGSLLDDKGNALMFDWKIFVRDLGPEKEEAVGNGITRVSIERFSDVLDPNTGTPRVDIVFHQVGGHQVRLHPHKGKEKAQLRFLEPERCNPWFVGKLWRLTAHHEERGLAAGEDVHALVKCTLKGLDGLTDTIGRPQACDFLISVMNELVLDLTDGERFSWPRFIASMAPADQVTVVGTGIASFGARALDGTHGKHVFVVYDKTGPALALWPGSKLCISRLVGPDSLTPENPNLSTAVAAWKPKRA